MFSDTVLVAIITGVVTAGCSVLGFIQAEKVRRDKVADSHLVELRNVQADITAKLEQHKKEYIEEIAIVKSSIQSLKNEVTDVRDSVTDVRATTQQAMAVIDLKIDTLEKTVSKHNSVIERTYKLEQDSAVQDEMIKVANKRIADLERKVEKME